MAEREQDLDVLRVVAAFAVVWLHVSGGVLVDTSRGLDAGWWIGNVANAMSRWCVPVFVMVSGALLLRSPLPDAPWMYFKRRLKRIMIPLVTWTGFYTLLTWLSPHGVLDGREVVIGILRGMPVAGFHLWYLYMCLGLYALVPVLQSALAGMPAQWRMPVLLVGFGMAAVESMVRLLTGVGTSATFVGICLPYLPYFVAGHLVRQQPTNKPASTYLLLAAAVVCGLAVAGLTGVLFPAMGKRSWVVLNGYLSPLVIVMSLCVYRFVIQVSRDGGLQSGPFSTLVRLCAPVTLGIYVLHPFCFLILGRLRLTTLSIHPVFGIPLTSAAAFLLAGALSWSLAWLPGFRRTVT